jgi:hypothetical protein
MHEENKMTTVALEELRMIWRGLGEVQRVD